VAPPSQCKKAPALLCASPVKPFQTMVFGMAPSGAGAEAPPGALPNRLLDLINSSRKLALICVISLYLIHLIGIKDSI